MLLVSRATLATIMTGIDRAVYRVARESKG
jgi:hypothetical protein